MVTRDIGCMNNQLLPALRDHGFAEHVRKTCLYVRFLWSRTLAFMGLRLRDLQPQYVVEADRIPDVPASLQLFSPELHAFRNSQRLAAMGTASFNKIIKEAQAMARTNVESIIQLLPPEKRPDASDTFLSYSDSMAARFFKAEVAAIMQQRLLPLLALMIEQDLRGQQVIYNGTNVALDLPANTIFVVAQIIASEVFGTRGPFGTDEEPSFVADALAGAGELAGGAGAAGAAAEPGPHVFQWESEQGRRTFAQRVRQHRDKSRLGPVQRHWLSNLARMNHDQLWDRYMPEVLQPVIPADHDGWRRRITSAVDKMPGRLFSFIYQVNESKFVQALCPQPSVKAGKILFTTSMLASVLRFFYDKQSPLVQDIIRFQFYNQADRVTEVLVQLFPVLQVDWRFSLDRTSDMTCHPLKLWPCVFPGLLGFARDGHLSPVAIEVDPPADRPPLQARGYQLMWHGSAHMDGRSIYVQFYDSHKPTRGITVAARRRNVPQRAFAYDNLLSHARNHEAAGGDFVLDLHEACGVRQADAGLAESARARGVLMLEKAIKERMMYLGSDAVRGLTHHTMVSIDLGVVNEISATVIVFWVEENGQLRYRALNHLFPTAETYNASGITEYVRRRNEEMLQYNLRALAEAPGQVLAPDRYMTHLMELFNHGDQILVDNYEDTKLHEKAKLANRKRSHRCSILNCILSLVDAMERRHSPEEAQKGRGAPIFVVGRPTFSGKKRKRRPAAPKALVDYFQRFFPVVLIDEYFTSKKCHHCHGKMVRHSRRGYRMWRCKSCVYHPRSDPTALPARPLIVNKDISATVNIFRIFIELIATGRRPAAFCRPQRR